jgi:hypothetical protein
VLAILLATVALLAPTLAIGPTPDGGETRNKGWDLNNHLAIAESIATRGLPPLNPFLDSEAPFYYHTFFHILLGGLLVVAGKGAPSYLLISLLTLLLAAVFLSTFHRFVLEITGDSRAALLALPPVSLVGGFDLIPMAVRAVLERDGIGSPARFFLRHWNVDGWVSNQGMLVPSFFASYFWAPHAVAAIVVFLLALLHLRGAGSPLFAGACLASMAGYNGYVALGGAAALVLLWGFDGAWFLRSRRRADRDLLGRGAAAGGAAVLLALPVLRLYLGQGGGTGGFRWARPGPLVPLQIVLEFGPAIILGLAGATLALRRREAPGRLLPAVSMGVVSLPVLCFVASTGENNDLAMRISLFPWMALAVFGGLALSRLFPALPDPAAGSRRARLAALAVIAPGCLSVIWFAAGAAVGKPALPADEVAAGRWVRTHVAPGLLVQGSPLRDNSDLVYLSGHPAVLSDTWTARLFHSKPEDYERRMAALQGALTEPDPSVACRSLVSLRIAALIVGPPEERDFPLLDRAGAWPCLSQAYQRGTYRVYRVSAPAGEATGREGPGEEGSGRGEGGREATGPWPTV